MDGYNDAKSKVAIGTCRMTYHQALFILRYENDNYLADLVVCLLRLDNCCSFKGAIIAAVLRQIRNEKILLSRLPQQHAENFDLLATSQDEV